MSIIPARADIVSRAPIQHPMMHKPVTAILTIRVLSVNFTLLLIHVMVGNAVYLG